MRYLAALIRRTILVLVGGVLCLLIGAVILYVHLSSRDRPLMPWHTEKLTAEFTAKQADRIRTLEDYQHLEDRLFQQLDEQVYARTATGPSQGLVRYSHGSTADPSRWQTNWNRTFDLPVASPRGVLLLHGMSDSPTVSMPSVWRSTGRDTGWSDCECPDMGRHRPAC